jgi:hypothetical protein
MREPVRAMRVVRIGRHRSLDLRPSGGELPILGQRQGMKGQEPPIVTVMIHRGSIAIPRAHADVSAWPANMRKRTSGIADDHGVPP